MFYIFYVNLYKHIKVFKIEYYLYYCAHYLLTTHVTCIISEEQKEIEKADLSKC